MMAQQSCCISEQTYPHSTASPLHQIGHAWHDRLRLLGSLNIFWRSLNIFLQLFEVCNITDIGSLRGLLKLLCWFFFCMIRFIESSLSLLWLVTHKPFISLFSQQTENNWYYGKHVSSVLLKSFWASLLEDLHHYSQDLVTETWIILTFSGFG